MRSGRTVGALVGLVVLATGVAACGDTKQSGNGELRVVATTTQIADFARNVGGDRITLTRLLAPNADPHDYEPTPKDVAAVADAQLVLEHGIDLDSWLDDVIDNAGGDATRVRVTDGIHLRPDGGAGDPHVWLDPRNAIAMVRNIARALATSDPAGADAYEANAKRYADELAALDTDLAAQIAPIGRQARTIVTDHDALGYFADRYAVTVVATVIPSTSTAAEPSAKDVAALVKTIRTSGARAVFSEASVDPRLVETIAKEAGVPFGPPLYADSLAPEGEPAATYTGMMRANMDAIIEGISP